MGIASPAPLNEKNLPALYQATDTAAKRHQRWFIVSTLVEAAFVLLGALPLILGQNVDLVSAVGSITSIQMFGIMFAPLSLATAVALLATAITPSCAITSSRATSGVNHASWVSVAPHWPGAMPHARLQRI